MSQNPLNLALRFALELAGLGAMGWWGWTRFDGALRFALAAGLPLLAAALWGTFRAPGDASASGRAPVAVRGGVRLLLEAAFFGFAAWALIDGGAVVWGRAFGAAVLVHYALSLDRIAWLLKR